MAVELANPSVETLFEPIECDYLDGENVGWAKRYIAQCQASLTAADQDDPHFAAYLQAEIAAWQELLQRFGKA
ncbi:MAG TPA: hypothetical protein V6D00_06720 [Pantanalinema sp.]